MIVLNLPPIGHLCNFSVVKPLGGNIPEWDLTGADAKF